MAHIKLEEIKGERAAIMIRLHMIRLHTRVCSKLCSCTARCAGGDYDQITLVNALTSAVVTEQVPINTIFPHTCRAGARALPQASMGDSMHWYLQYVLTYSVERNWCLLALDHRRIVNTHT